MLSDTYRLKTNFYPHLFTAQDQKRIPAPINDNVVALSRIDGVDKFDLRAVLGMAPWMKRSDCDREPKSHIHTCPLDISKAFIRCDFDTRVS